MKLETYSSEKTGHNYLVDSDVKCFYCKKHIIDLVFLHLSFSKKRSEANYVCKNCCYRITLKNDIDSITPFIIVRDYSDIPDDCNPYLLKAPTLTTGRFESVYDAAVLTHPTERQEGTQIINNCKIAFNPERNKALGIESECEKEPESLADLRKSVSLLESTTAKKEGGQ